MRNGLMALLSAGAFVAVAGCADYTADDDPEDEAPAATGGGGASEATGGGGSGATGGGGAPSGGAGAATGGDGTGATDGGESISPTISGGVVLNTLTDEQFTQLCDDTWDYFGANVQLDTICKYRGLSLATSSSARSDEEAAGICTEQVSTCQTNPDTAWSGNSGCSSIPDDCTATVAEYSACIEATAAAFSEAVGEMPLCADFSSAASDMVWALKGAERLPECLLNNCSSLWAPQPSNF